MNKLFNICIIKLGTCGSMNHRISIRGIVVKQTMNDRMIKWFRPSFVYGKVIFVIMWYCQGLIAGLRSLQLCRKIEFHFYRQIRGRRRPTTESVGGMFHPKQQSFNSHIDGSTGHLTLKLIVFVLIVSLVMILIKTAITTTVRITSISLCPHYDDFCASEVPLGIVSS